MPVGKLDICPQCGGKSICYNKSRKHCRNKKCGYEETAPNDGMMILYHNFTRGFPKREIRG